VIAAAPAALQQTPTPTTFTVAAGRSAGGQHWVQTTHMEFGSVVVELSLPGPDGVDGGGGMRGRPTARAPLRMIAQGDGLGRTRDETEIDGAVPRVVRALRVTTARRTVLVHTRPAPRRALRRWPTLRQVRYFVHFFAGGDQALSVRALDARGAVIAERALR
jgi:hypothetical protein